ncbi:MAG: hypothetical protein LBL16_00365 [Endomicrobium sp.]|jgi:hypothetical protein|nr:hypothetical protein [Endomicrobium sp.]
MTIKIVSAFLILLMSLAGCGSNKVARQATHKICSPAANLPDPEPVRPELPFTAADLQTQIAEREERRAQAEREAAARIAEEQRLAGEQRLARERAEAAEAARIEREGQRADAARRDTARLATIRDDVEKKDRNRRKEYCNIDHYRWESRFLNLCTLARVTDGELEMELKNVWGDREKDFWGDREKVERVAVLLQIANRSGTLYQRVIEKAEELGEQARCIRLVKRRYRRS